MINRLLLPLLCMLAGCAGARIDNPALQTGQPVPPSAMIRWKVDPDCMARAPMPVGSTREDLAHACPDPAAHDFISLSLSGGGTKAAIFSGETLFYLQALGLLQRTDVISSVSGGSFTGALYAVSCDPGDTGCTASRPHGAPRPVWQHDTVLKTLGRGYQDVIDEQIVRLLIPGVQSTIGADRFAEIIDRDYLASTGDRRFLFADISPRRPHLFMNATITSENRAGLGTYKAAGCKPLNGGYLRRRTPDEYFHFAFSDFYFGLLRSDIASYPLAAGVAASAAFPALIDNAVLQDHCGLKGASDTVRLMDGGTNDNQALIEIYAVLAELVYGQHRSDRWADPIERLRPGDRAWALVVNSSVTETTGEAATGGGNEPHGAAAFASTLVEKILSATDTYSAEGYNLRKQAYLAQAALVQPDRRYGSIRPYEISLTELDQYHDGGTEAALRAKAGLGAGETSDAGERLADEHRTRQAKAYDAIVHNAAARAALHLSDWHPQCYFDMRARLDASLVSIEPDDQACLREAARWATALRAQEMCDTASPGDAPPAGLSCTDGKAALTDASALQDDVPKTAQCSRRMPRLPITLATDTDPEVQCQHL